MNYEAYKALRRTTLPALKEKLVIMAEEKRRREDTAIAWVSVATLVAGIIIYFAW